MPIVSKLKLGSTTYDIADESARSQVVDVKSYLTPDKVMPFAAVYVSGNVPLPVRFVRVPEVVMYIAEGNIDGVEDCNDYVYEFNVESSGWRYRETYEFPDVPDSLKKLFGTLVIESRNNATPTSAGWMSAADKSKLNSLTTNLATSTAKGYMSAADKKKLDGLSSSSGNSSEFLDLTGPITALLGEGNIGGYTEKNFSYYYPSIYYANDLYQYPLLYADIPSEISFRSGQRLQEGRYILELRGPNNRTSSNGWYLILHGSYGSSTAYDVIITISYGDYGHGSSEFGVSAYNIVE